MRSTWIRVLVWKRGGRRFLRKNLSQKPNWGMSFICPDIQLTGVPATTSNCNSSRDVCKFWHFHCFFHRRIYDQRKIDENENNGVLKKFCPHHLVRFMKGQWLQASLTQPQACPQTCWYGGKSLDFGVRHLDLNPGSTTYQFCDLGQSPYLC